MGNAQHPARCADFVPLHFYGTNADDMIAYIVSRFRVT